LAEGHHDIALADEADQLIAKKRINESVTGPVFVINPMAVAATASGRRSPGPCPGVGAAFVAG
jgi:hypothetical protein